MNKWIGIYGSATSGIKSREEATAWCAQLLAAGKPGSGTKAFLCEVEDEVRLTTPTHETIPYAGHTPKPAGNGAHVNDF